MLRLQRPNEIPPGGLKYLVAETSTWVSGPTLPDWLTNVRKHLVANGLPVPSDLMERMQDQLCETMGPGVCEYSDGRPSAGWNGFGIFISQVVQGTSTLADWLLAWGGKKVEANEAERRASICVGCHYNQFPSGCTGCSSKTLLAAVARVVGGGASTSHHHQLNACALCGCSLKAKVWLPLELLWQHTSAEKNNQLPAKCWLKR